MSESKRLDLFTRVVALGFILGIVFSKTLWLSSRLYPLTPLVPFLGPLPYPFDYLAVGVLIALLGMLFSFPRSRVLLFSILAFIGFFFLQDQSRLWPSFYEFSFFLLILSSFRKGTGDDEREASRVLNAGRFVLAAVYFWSGFLKYTPSFFYGQFPWFFAPVTAYVPAVIPFMPALAVLAVIAEVQFALGLLTKRFRKLSFAEATVMHTLIFFLIGPLRANWNDSAWLWSALTVSFLWILNFRAPAFDWKTLFTLDVRRGLRSTYAVPTLLAVLCIGILPVLNGINAWDSGMSFNVYTGNVATAQLYATDAVAKRLPEALKPFTERVSPDSVIIGIIPWAEAKFNAGPYPEPRIYRSILRALCPYADSPNGLVLSVTSKTGWFMPKQVSTYSCASPS